MNDRKKITIGVCLFGLLFSLLCSAENLRSIHVFVALCDNNSQGIVPVSNLLGNGDDPRNNLYWGAMYGAKTFLKKSSNWQLLSTTNTISPHILERCIFKHRSGTTLLIADAYTGSSIKSCLHDFFSAAAGRNAHTITITSGKAGMHGNADLVCYIGHNGLMDFSLDKLKRSTATPPKHVTDTIVLACKSKPYFEDRLVRSGARPLLLTTGFMAPEAYTLEAALEGWIRNENGEQIRIRAAQAYNKYQKCGMKGAQRLFYTGTSTSARRNAK
jgi:hypothetical protein